MDNGQGWYLQAFLLLASIRAWNNLVQSLSIWLELFILNWIVQHQWLYKESNGGEQFNWTLWELLHNPLAKNRGCDLGQHMRKLLNSKAASDGRTIFFFQITAIQNQSTDKTKSNINDQVISSANMKYKNSKLIKSV